MTLTIPTGFNTSALSFPSVITPANMEDPVNSPQYAQNMPLDVAQIGVSSLLVGRITAKQATLSMQLSQANQKPASALGLSFKTALRTAGKSGLAVGAVSVLRNGYHLAQGEINIARASGNVGADMLGGTVGGMVAATGASLAVKMMSGSSAFGMGTVGLIAGAAAFALADTAYNMSGLRETVSNKITGIVERWFDVDNQGGGV